METKTYRVVFRRTEEWWIVSSPDLPGAHTQGKTMEEAWEAFGDAASLMFGGDQEEENRPSILVRSHISGMVGRVVREGSNFWEAEWPRGGVYTVKKWDSDIVEQCSLCEGAGYVERKEE